MAVYSPPTPVMNVNHIYISIDIYKAALAPTTPDISHIALFAVHSMSEEPKHGRANLRY
jgi:hypothetical protein